MPTTKTPTDQEIVEVLATKGMGEPLWRVKNQMKWLPTAFDPLNNLNHVRDVEERLTDRQWHTYWLLMVTDSWAKHFRNFKTGRHADARTCCLALWEVLKGV